MFPEYNVIVRYIGKYSEEEIYSALDDSLFEPLKNATKVVLKPNWVRSAHLERTDEWDYVITHPAMITAVLKKVMELMPKRGRISIVDGPEFSASIEKILAYYPVEKWREAALENEIEFEILDLREEIWEDDGNVVIKRKKNSGDKRGNTGVNLIENLSEFYRHIKSRKGYYGADSNIVETNMAHNGKDNLYRVSKTVMESDVFINLPKLKTHKKAGITCCLKNLVGINTYRNYLPHCSLGTRDEGGDQFFLSGKKQKIEGKIMPLVHQYIRTSTFLSRLFSPLMKIGKKVFGTNSQTIRAGSWYGNDTIWRMILDLNKILLYANADGTLRHDYPVNRKTYIGVVDAILCGEGNGPKIPDPKQLNYLIQGNNPLSIDVVCAELMGFDSAKIPVLQNAFSISRLKLCSFEKHQIRAIFEDGDFNIDNITDLKKTRFRAPNGWSGHIEK